MRDKYHAALEIVYAYLVLKFFAFNILLCRLSIVSYFVVQHVYDFKVIFAGKKYHEEQIAAIVQVIWFGIVFMRFSKFENCTPSQTHLVFFAGKKQHDT